MLFKSQLLTQASGSLGGVTASRNKGGMYFRARALVTNPNSPGQQDVRAAMSLLVDRWVTVLTPAQRAGWGVYATNVPLIGPTGDPRDVGAIGQYVRSNVPRLRAGLSVVDTAPTTFDQAPAPDVTGLGAISGVGIGNGLTLTISNVPGAGDVLVQSARPQNPSVLFFKGPFRFAGVDDMSPLTITNANLPWACELGARMFVRCRFTMDDGRLGPAVIVSAIST